MTCGSSVSAPMRPLAITKCPSTNIACDRSGLRQGACPGMGGRPAMWTAADGERYGRDGLRYPSDLADAEWALIAPLIRPAKRGGRRRSVAVREVMNGLLYVLETGCPWRPPPRGPPPRRTGHGSLGSGDTSELQSPPYLVCRLMLAQKNT